VKTPSVSSKFKESRGSTTCNWHTDWESATCVVGVVGL